MPDFQILTAATGWSTRGPHVRLTGRCADGKSVAVTIRGVFPHMYAKVEGALLNAAGDANTNVLGALENDLNTHLNKRVRA